MSICLSKSELHNQPAHYILSDQQIALWSIHVPDHQVCQYWSVLDSTEQQRAARFRFETDRRCFIIAHGLLRILLSRYLHCSAESIEFHYNAYGKPYLIAIEPLAVPLYFNLSHSRNWVFVGISRTADIGVDVEYMDSRVDRDPLVSRFFSEKEVEAYYQLPPEEKEKGFYNAWTRKEAFIKAVGKGLAYPLKQFSVSLAPNQPACLISLDGDENNKKDWCIRDIGFDPSYCAAVCWHGVAKTVLFRQFFA